jgi:hypothetical protein
MDEKLEKQMAIMIDAVQPFCDEPIIAAMTCSHTGSMKATLISKFLGGIGAPLKSSSLPNPVFMAVGTDTIYAFDYRPRGFRFKIKKEAARWLRKEVQVSVEKTVTMARFVLSIGSGESFNLEIPTLIGGSELADRFLEALGGQR